ncbi:MAG: hypothetical protein ACLQK8_29110 [Streptosporangiaceae bacterium]|nr:hypothetical protein [Actinomycetota bacterium]
MDLALGMAGKDRTRQCEVRLRCHGDLDAVTAGLGFQLVWGSLGDDRTPVDDDDPAGQLISFF